MQDITHFPAVYEVCEICGATEHTFCHYTEWGDDTEHPNTTEYFTERLCSKCGDLDILMEVVDDG